MKTKGFYVMLVLLFAISCGGNGDDPVTTTPTQNNNNNSGNTNSDWLIPKSEVKDGGPGKDGIPSIDNPIFVGANDQGASFLTDDDLVVGIINGDKMRAYPHLILDWHEVVNDEINGDFLTISYCPLTGTAFGWESKSNDEKSTFGVSGLLYNANLIMYDRNTDSNWSQLKLQCVNGKQIGDVPTVYKVVETNWKTWKTLYPNTEVLSLDTGYSRNYGAYPYGDYKTNHGSFIFFPSTVNADLPSKQRVFAVIEEEASRAYKFESFNNGKVVREVFKGKELLVVGNEDAICSFELQGDQINLTYEYDFNDFEAFFKDDEGNKWSIFGEAVEGPRMGEMLKATKSVVSYWFAIAVFYPDPEIY